MTSKYLYDIEPEEFIHLPYKEAIQLKKEKSMTLYKKLHNQTEEFYHNGGKYSDVVDLRNRLHYVGKAMKHNEILLKELK